MTTMDLKRRWRDIQKATHLVVLAFFLCALSTRAQSNTVSNPTVYGPDRTVATATNIVSTFDGATDLDILYPDTTALTLGHDITGYIAIDNAFSNFTIQAAGASVSAPTSPALMVDGGGILKITGGTFSTTNGTAGGGPGLPPSSINLTGIRITGTTQTTLDGTTVLGGSESGIGGPALQISDGALIVTGDSVLTGGIESSAVSAQNADLLISNGTFTAGTGGRTLSLSEGSSAAIYGGVFNTRTDAQTFFLLDSDLFLHNGTVSNGTLGSVVSEGSTNTVLLNTGTFDSLVFQGSTNSLQFFTAGTNLTDNTDLFQFGGRMVVSNRVADIFSTVRLSEGASVEFLHDFILPSGGVFWLDSENEQAAFDSLTVSSGATLSLNTGRISADYFTAAGDSTNRFSITSDAQGMLEADTAHFQTDSAMIVDVTAVGISSTETNTYALVSTTTGQLFAGADTNSAATAETFKENVDIETTSTDRTRFLDLYFETVGGDTILNFQFTAKPLAEYWGLTNGNDSVVTEEFADELDQLASSEMLGIIDTINNPGQSLAAIEETYFTTPNTFQTILHGMQAAVGQSVSRGAEFRDQLQLPTGAKGPEPKNDLRGWGKYYGQLYSHDADGLNPEYDTTLHGGVVGIDKSLGRLLLGISGGGGRYSSETVNDGREDISAYHGALYGTFGSERTYLDAGVAYGFNEVETRTADPFVLEGEFDARMLTAYLGGGFDLVDTPGGTIFTPEASIQYSTYEQDAYTETSTVAVPREIEAFDADSLRSSLGLNVSMLNTSKLETFGFKLDGRFHWLHEFNPDPGNMTFRLEGGSNDYQLAAPLLDEDLFRAGIGFSFFNTLRQKPKNVLLRLDFDELFGDGFNSHNFSAKVIYAF